MKRLLLVLTLLIACCSCTLNDRQRPLTAIIVRQQLHALDNSESCSLGAATTLFRKWGLEQESIADSIFNIYLQYEDNDRERLLAIAEIDREQKGYSRDEQQNWITQNRTLLWQNFYNIRTDRCLYPAPYPDYKRIKVLLGSFLSASMNQYLDIKAAEVATPLKPCEAMPDSPAILVDRVIALEYFIRNHPDFIRITYCKQLWSVYLDMLLQGNNRQAPLDAKEHLTGYFREAYEYLEHHYPASETQKVVKPWHDALLHFQSKSFLKLRRQYEGKKWLLIHPACCGLC